MIIRLHLFLSVLFLKIKVIEDWWPTIFVFHLFFLSARNKKFNVFHRVKVIFLFNFLF